MAVDSPRYDAAVLSTTLVPALSGGARRCGGHSLEPGAGRGVVSRMTGDLQRLTTQHHRANLTGLAP